MAQVIERPAALIVAHGSPSRPDEPEAATRMLAAAVAARLGGWRVRGATLATEGSLASAVAALRGGPVQVFPHFMSDGWFVSKALPRRLAEAGAASVEILAPFGMTPGIEALCLRRAVEAAAARDLALSETTLLIAAHGSPSDRRPAEATRDVARAIAAARLFREVRVGFVDEAPYLADAARIEAPALCLPFFAGRAGHVETDLPEALVEAGFPGVALAPIGCDAEAPAIIAAALAARVARRAA